MKKRAKKKGNKKRCRWCGKILEGSGKKLYYNDSHKASYYTALRTFRVYKDGPEQFIKKELVKPVNQWVPPESLNEVRINRIVTRCKVLTIRVT